ncbi:hypothetical protein DO72_5179 [Burkholderia pseudomallei]|uniref:Uncharacterized protein n=1 Tax=Burkholderia pseudomallei TaxID=28450 RepID=A0AA40MA14_BURPE|nr:hypothetical protein DO72_5179 [Burkholderia pseudomallei]KGX05525.1 hypothetical protein Y036_3468 [Burkholderia pseudomallei]
MPAQPSIRRQRAFASRAPEQSRLAAIVRDLDERTSRPVEVGAVARCREWACRERSCHAWKRSSRSRRRLSGPHHARGRLPRSVGAENPGVRFATAARQWRRCRPRERAFRDEYVGHRHRMYPRVVSGASRRVRATCGHFRRARSSAAASELPFDKGMSDTAGYRADRRRSPREPAPVFAGRYARHALEPLPEGADVGMSDALAERIDTQSCSSRRFATSIRGVCGYRLAAVRCRWARRCPMRGNARRPRFG